MPNALINGVTLHYEDTGSDLPAVVLSHGFLMDHEMFAPQVAALRSTHRVVTWDERGFGGTLANEEFTYWDSAKDVLGLMDFLGIDSAVIGGMSQGGFLSLRVALTAPERVRGLILLDTQAGLEEPGSDDGYMLMHDTWMEHGPSRFKNSLPASFWALVNGQNGLPSGQYSIKRVLAVPSVLIAPRRYYVSLEKH